MLSNQNLLMRVKEEGETAALKLSIQEIKIMASGPITSWQIDGEKVEAVTGFIFLGSKITVAGTAAMKSKDACSLEGKLTNLASVLKAGTSLCQQRSI